ncbi:MAG TPA: hypothetical protein VGH13_23045 [Xanthobacteraceae bacterium]|jgi:hypothetical protein
MTDAADHTVLGPAMAALPEKRQLFVLAMFEDTAPKRGQGLLIYAAKRAGYGTSTSSVKALSVIASRIAHDPRVQAAIHETTQKALGSLAPETVRALRDIVRDPKSKDHIRGLDMVLARTAPVQTSHTLKIEDNRSQQITPAMLKRIDDLAAKFGLLLPSPTVIDGECVEVDA